MGLETRIPSIPDTDLFPERALRAMRETHEVREGRRGDPLDAFISIRDLQTLLATDATIVAILDSGHLHDGATLEFDGVNANGSSHSYRTTAQFDIYCPSLQVEDLAANVRFDITALGRVGLGAAWDNTFGNDLTTAKVYTTQTMSSAWGSTRSGLVRIIDCLRLPAGTYGVNYNTFQLHNSISVATGASVARTVYLAQYYNLRNFDLAATDDSGTLSTLIGLAFTYGHFNTNITAVPITTLVYGITMTPFMQCSTVGTFYDLRIAIPNIAGGRSPAISTAHYPISQEAGDDSVSVGKTRNYFNARTGFKTADPQGVVEIEDAATTYTQLLKITQDDANVYGLVIGNDTYSTTDTLGLRLSLGNTGSAIVENSGALDLYLRAIGTVNASDLYFQSEDQIYFQDYNAGTPATRGGWNMQTADMAVGTSVTAGYRLLVQRSDVDTSNRVAYYVSMNQDYQNTSTYYNRGAYLNYYINPTADYAANNTGYDRGFECQILGRQNFGILAEVTGMLFNVGTYGPGGADVSGTITVLYGYRFVGYSRTSTVIGSAYGYHAGWGGMIVGPLTGYGLYLDALPASTGTKWGIYQAGTADRNYFSSITGTGFGSGCTSPVANVEIEDGVTAKTILCKITQDDANVYGLVIGNDTYSTTDTLGLRLSLGNTGSAILENSGVLDLFLRAIGTVNTSDVHLQAERNILFQDYNAGTPITKMTLDVITGQLQLSIATGTSPFSITSTTVCTNLNADLWDGYQFSDYLDQAVKTTSKPTFAGGILTKVATTDVTAIPTAAEITTAFGTPASAGAGFIGVINDNGAGVSVYVAVSDGTSWFWTLLTKAV